MWLLYITATTQYEITLLGHNYTECILLWKEQFAIDVQYVFRI